MHGKTGVLRGGRASPPRPRRGRPGRVSRTAGGSTVREDEGHRHRQRVTGLDPHAPPGTGEVLGSGTVGTGCLLELNGSKITEDLWLREGDQVVLAVEGLGRLENTVALAPEPGLPSTLVARGPRLT